MDMNGSTIIWFFGISLGVIGSLAGIIWAQLNRRLAFLENWTMKRDDKNSETMSRIFTEIETTRKEISDTKIILMNSFVTKEDMSRELNWMKERIEKKE